MQSVRPPNNNLDQWIEAFRPCLEHANVSHNEIIVMGDINIDLKVHDTKCKKLMSVTNEFCLEQLIEEPTRVTSSSSTLIDHVYVSDPHKTVSSGVLKLSLSDHYAVWARHHNKCPEENKINSHRVIEFRQMKHFDVQQFKSDLFNMPWNNVMLHADPNCALEVWYDMFLSVVNIHAPKKKKRVKTWQQPEWLTPAILEAIKLRQNYKKEKRFFNYRNQRNLVKQLVKKAKHDYYAKQAQMEFGNV